MEVQEEEQKYFQALQCQIGNNIKNQPTNKKLNDENHSVFLCSQIKES